MPATERLRVTERFIRRDFGRMDIEITIDDPKTYTRPWMVTQALQYQADNELIEYICNENNRYFDIVPSAAPPGRPAAAPPLIGPGPVVPNAQCPNRTRGVCSSRTLGS
jgi:hypothetical protein